MSDTLLYPTEDNGCANAGRYDARRIVGQVPGREMGMVPWSGGLAPRKDVAGLVQY